MRHCLRAALAAVATLAALHAGAQNLSYNGLMGDKVLLVIDGQPRTLALGATVQGVRLVGMSADEARVEVGGRQVVLHHGTPVNLGGAASAGTGQEIVLTAGLGGHFRTGGSINGKSVNFMVDTGATTVAISAGDAERIGLDYRGAPRIAMGTANGVVGAWRVNLTSVRVGDVEIHNVEATVIPAAMDSVLLGNTFLARFQMKRDNDVMRLEKRR